MNAIPQSDLTMDEQRTLKDFEQRRRATERTATCYLAAFARAHWADFEAFMKDHDEETAYFLPIVEEWRQTHALYQAVRAGLPRFGVSDDEIRGLGRRMQYLAEDIEHQSERFQRSLGRGMKPEAQVAEALLPLLTSLRTPARLRAEDGDTLMKVGQAASGVRKRMRGAMPGPLRDERHELWNKLLKNTNSPESHSPQPGCAQEA
jgi:hypothetical protein